MKNVIKAIIGVILIGIFCFLTLKYTKVNAEEVVKEQEENQEIINENGEIDQSILDEVNNILESNQFVNTIVTILISFVGSGGFFIVLRMLFNKTIKHFKARTNEALTSNLILKEEYEKKMKQLEELEKMIEDKINNFEINVNKLCDAVQEKLRLDKEKKEEADKIIKDLIDGENK